MNVRTRLGAPILHVPARIKTEEALNWYDRHMAEAPSVDEIAHAVLISPVHLRRLFHRAHGQSPHMLLNRRRMQRVEALLQDKSIRLAALAAQVGFSSVSALSRATKTHFGLSPRELRKRERIPVAPGRPDPRARKA